MKNEQLILNDYNLNFKVVKGRAEYSCAWCGKSIHKGCKHTFYNGRVNSGSWWKSYRFHNECYEYLGRDERNVKFGFKKGKNLRVDDNVKKMKKYLCKFWEAVLIPGSRKIVPFKREVEIIAGSPFLAREACEDEFTVLEYIGASVIRSKIEEDKRLNKFIGTSRGYDIKRKLRAIKSS